MPFLYFIHCTADCPAFLPTNILSQNVSSNRLRHLPALIGDLRSLRELNAARNALRCLPYSIGDMDSLTVLEVSGNPQLLLPPRSVIAAGPDAVKQFLHESRHSGVPFSSIKLMLVGHGGAGKTTLVEGCRRLEEGPLRRAFGWMKSEADVRTTFGANVGIDVLQIDREIQFCVWDIAGASSCSGHLTNIARDVGLLLACVSVLGG